jgi:cytochrome c553
MMQRTAGTLSGLALALALATGTAHAAGDVEAGKQKAMVCQACHGPDGNGIGDPQYPLIAGQYADYLVFALKSYKIGTRQNAIMSGFVAPLSDQDMEDLAAYFASQPAKLRDLSHLK